MNRWAVTILCCGTVLAYLVTLVAIYQDPEHHGIHRHLSKRATYLEGESCVIDAHAGVTHEQFHAMTRWCDAQFEADHTPR